MKIGLDDSEENFSYLVKRLTREPAEFFNLDAGSLEIGARADLTALNPHALSDYDGEDSIRYIYRELFDCHQLVNSSDGVVDSVFVGGEEVWSGSNFTPVHGAKPLAGALRASNA